ncbi:MAG: MFS transporter [Leptolyngbya sp. PLA2]|nr:MFS transporter [Leptolyngbya sp.]MCE7971762.1 MFS transporter [Leptolyngbya sp. PL-A2]MDL1904800.1 MFS transporter [Synechococcales cyanobacterium CNB]
MKNAAGQNFCHSHAPLRFGLPEQCGFLAVSPLLQLPFVGRPFRETALPGSVSIGVMSAARLRAGVAIGAHTAVDFYSFLPIGLLPLFRARLDATPAQVALLLAVGSVTSGLVQPAAAFVSDRLNTRSIGTLGLLVAAVAICVMPFAPSFAVLLALYSAGAAGVGAFHPPAVAAVGQLAGRRRSLAVSVFFLAGMGGGILGNVLPPQQAARFGVESLAWLAIPGVAVAAALAWAIHAVAHRRHDAHEKHRGLSRVDRRRRWAAVWLLYAGNFVRFSVNMALVYLLLAWVEERVRSHASADPLALDLAQRASAINGAMQAAMQVGMGCAGLAAGWFLRAHHEKAALVAVPMLGAAAAALIPNSSIPAGFALTVVAGAGFGGLVPVTIALAQRLLPHRTSLASSLMMGGAWAFAGVGSLAAERLHHALGLGAAFFVTAGALAVAGVLSLLLPGPLLRSIDPH